MVGGKLFKTRICVLYRQGRCHRQSCSFAHGDAELRRYNDSSSFNARRDYRGADLRDRLERQWSPPRRNSLDRDSLPSPRFGKKSDWGHRKRQHFDGENDYSGNLRLADKKPSSSEFNDTHNEQLKHLQSEIDILEDHKHQLQIYLEESAQVAVNLNSKIEELEMQLSNEKDECKRISSKIRKFVRANNRHARIQEELKRSQARLQRLGDQLCSDVRGVANDDDINTSMLSDEETMENHSMSPKIHSPRRKDIYGNHLIKDQFRDSPSKKRMRVHIAEAAADERSKHGYVTEDRANFGNMRSERHSRRDPHLAEMKSTSESNGINNIRPIKRKSNFNNSPSKNKYKDLKSTGMAANAVDEEVEVDELNEKLAPQENSSTRVELGSEHGNLALPLPPPPPISPNAYLQYKEKNEKVDAVNDDDNDDVDVDDDELLDVDIV